MTTPLRLHSSQKRGNLATQRPAIVLASLVLAIFFFLRAGNLSDAASPTQAATGTLDANPTSKGTVKRCKLAVTQCNSIDLPDEEICSLLKGATGSTFGGGCGGSSSAGKAGTLASIPKLIHQSWKETTIPKTFTAWSQTWRDQNPTWQYKLWTDEDNRNLVAHHYSWLLNAYDNLPSKIMKADIVRNLYMHRHGGVYSDLDTVAMQPMDELFRSLPAERSAVLARMSDDEAFEHNIPNAWMASTPGHPFWLFIAAVIERQSHRTWLQRIVNLFYPLRPEYVTGPVLLKHAYDTWQCILGTESGVTLLKPKRVFVADWHNETALDIFLEECNGDDILSELGRKRCFKSYPSAYVLTYWTHSWSKRKRV